MVIDDLTLGAGRLALDLLGEDGTSDDTLLLLELIHSADPTTIKSQDDRTSLKEEDSVIPVGGGDGFGAGLGNFSFGSGRHNGTPVCASTGTSQYVDLGYGCLITLQYVASHELWGLYECVATYLLSGLQPWNQCSSTSTRFHPIHDVNK